MDCTDDKPEFTVELRKLLKLAGPLLFVSFLQFSLQIIFVMFVGRLGHLVSASLTTFITGIGMGAALETLCGRAYGAEQYHMLGVHMQRASFRNPLHPNFRTVVIYWPNSPIPEAGKFHLQVSRGISSLADSKHFAIRYSSVPDQIPADSEHHVPTNDKCRCRVRSPRGILLVLIYSLHMGNNGACLANGVTYWTISVILMAYIKFSGSCQNTWRGFNLDCARDLMSFLKLGVPSGLMTCLEFWSYQVFIILAGLFPNPQLETSMILISTRVSKELGAGKPKAARLAVRIVLFLAVFQGLLATTIATAASSRRVGFTLH
ncbi:Protein DETOXIFICATION 16 [Linum grandiflorum]